MNVSRQQHAVPPTQPEGPSEEHPRLRFAKSEIARVLTALEEANGDELSKDLRILHLEDQLGETREMAARWRRNFEAVSRLIAYHGTNPPLEELQRLMREWAGKA